MTSESLLVIRSSIIAFMRRASPQYVVGMVLCLALAACPAWGQDLQVDGTSYYRFARPGQNTIRVIVLGGANSGVYEIGTNVDLAELLALSGGPGGSGRSRTTVRLYRARDGSREQVFEAEMEDFVARTEYPALQAGDTVRIETIERERFGWRDGISILTAAASLTFAIERLFFD